MIGLTLLGATGHIGISTLDVISLHKDKYKIVALTANRNIALLAEQCVLWEPKYAVIADHDSAESLRAMLVAKGLGTEVLSGTEELQYVTTLPEVQYVVAGIVGAAGLLPTLAAAKAGKRILLANKESLVMSGNLLMDMIDDHGAEILPIDSEHNAIFQCLPTDSVHNLGQDNRGVEKLLLTASGGPFRDIPLDELGTIAPQQACAHPNWDMGKKVSVDSATMMNKGLELIEACWLFGIDVGHIEVVLHPQSIIHSMVQYIDGSILAQLSNPDIRVAIAHALAWPERMKSGVDSLDLCAVAQLDFQEPDLQRFPCLRLAQEAIISGGTSATILNAANEIAVAEFLDERLSFIDIPRLVEAALENITQVAVDSIADVLSADAEAREFCRAYARTELAI